MVRLLLPLLALPIISAAHPALLGAQGGRPSDSTTAAERRDTSRTRELPVVQVSGRADDLLGIASSASEGRVGFRDLQGRPIMRVAELLENVPGMIVTQHSGEGKANQYFVRGFNLDHGTDFQTRVEGMMVNQPSHGHGQGYTDLNFVIPEFVDQLEYRLGVHHADVGDFGSAGAADLKLRRSIARPFAAAEAGPNGLARLVAGASTSAAGGTFMAGGEAKAYDGPWVLPQRTRKASGLARYTRAFGTGEASVLAMAYRNRWNANDQIPVRAVRDGTVDRFGQIDSTDGGRASRYSLSLAATRLTGSAVQQIDLYAVRSDFELFSNFTFFLDDPERGDQFAQVDRRTTVGAAFTHRQQASLLGRPHIWRLGLQSRADAVSGSGLHRTERRVRHTTVRSDRVWQRSVGTYAEGATTWTPRIRTVLALRGDWYGFDVRSDRAENSGTAAAAIVSPKLSLVLRVAPQTELYVSGGGGFHSNDARGATLAVDPVTGEPADPVDPLVRSRGAEVGMRTSPLREMRTTVTAWALQLDSELLFVGDGGGTAPSAGSVRRGITVANFYRPHPRLSLDADVSVASARLRQVSAIGKHVPGALERVVAAGASWRPLTRGTAAAVRVRHFGSYALTENNRVRAPEVTLLGATASHEFASGTRVQLTVLNATNSRADDIQYFYTSRLPNERDGVDGVHAHPMEPRQLRVALEQSF